MNKAKPIKILLDILYPPYANCLACGKKRIEKAEEGLCNHCRKSFWADYREEKALTLTGFEKCFYPFTYQGVNSTLIKKLKFGQVKAAALPLAQAMGKSLDDFDEKIDALVPIPLYITRKRKRGFNQAEVLGKELEKITGIPLVHGLIRKKNTSPQTKLNKKQRKENVEEAFEGEVVVKGKTLLLIDDVITTGATAIAAAKALKAMGIKKVYLLTAAHAPLEKGWEKNND